MPPRKRAQSAPNREETDEQTVEPLSQAAAGAGGGDEAPAESSAPGDSGGDAPTAEPEAQEPPERSDIQSGQPCPECFPGGWAAKDDSVGAVGCEHGTWQREPAN